MVVPIRINEYKNLAIGITDRYYYELDTLNNYYYMLIFYGNNNRISFFTHMNHTSA